MVKPDTSIGDDHSTSILAFRVPKVAVVLLPVVVAAKSIV